MSGMNGAQQNLIKRIQDIAWWSQQVSNPFLSNNKQLYYICNIILQQHKNDKSIVWVSLSLKINTFGKYIFLTLDFINKSSITIQAKYPKLMLITLRWHKK